MKLRKKMARVGYKVQILFLKVSFFILLTKISMALSILSNKLLSGLALMLFQTTFWILQGSVLPAPASGVDEVIDMTPTYRSVVKRTALVMVEIFIDF